MTEKSAEEILSKIFDQEELILAVLSSPRGNQKYQKITIRPLSSKGELLYQVTELTAEQAFHSNLSANACLEKIKENITLFKQASFFTKSADYQFLISKKLTATILKKPPTKTVSPLLHNREKSYLLKEDFPTPFLIHLGIMNAEGKVYPKKRDKFKQMNRFLEVIEDIIPHFDKAQPLRIIDFGCGKAYLTFALYHYLKLLCGYNVSIHGLDLKKQVIEDCQGLAKDLGYADLSFSLGDICSYQSTTPIDIVVSLHACDTATDAALAQAIQWQARVILCVPCCQHELLTQVRNETLQPLLKHGILKERFAALATDAARAQLLEIAGYKTQVMEFIDMEHTPKNLLIRAVKKTQSPDQVEKNRAAYKEFKETLQIKPYLERIIMGGTFDQT